VGWGLGLAGNAVVAVAYLAIATVIAGALMRSGQLRSNPLGAATAAIFVTCAVHHGSHSVHMALPWLGIGTERGLAMRASYDVTMATWDVVTAAVGVYYWSLRRSYAPMMRGAKLFDDVRQREQQALELNDNVLQGLVVARLALDLGQHDKAREALESSIGSAGAIISDLLEADRRPTSAGLLRSSPALQARPARPSPEQSP
jgi:succinate dehydrogenase/fumarate reductase cytochrome b subunit